ncbi:MAG: class I SAM-dependent methyltransferase [Bacillus sp. (in: firmicutes)]
MSQQYEIIATIADTLENANIPYTFIEEAALTLQGVPVSLGKIQVLIQWDVFSACHNLFLGEECSAVEKSVTGEQFDVQIGGISVTFACRFNTTIKTDPYRIQVNHIWCKSLYSYLYGEDFAAYHEEIVTFLHNKQREYTEHNEQAWNQNNYQALLARYGEPEVIAAKIKRNPAWRLHPFHKYMRELEGKKVLHLLGSNGVKGTALALLGADVTVVDFSQENATFALEVAKAADVPLNYIVSDVFSLPVDEMAGQYDYVLMELGVLHYFITLEPLMEQINKLLSPQGVYILHEFHPISTKLITSSGKKHKVTGNYFNPEWTYNTVAFSKHMPDGVQEELLETVQRKWTIGELITSVARAGLLVDTLEEEPNHKLHDIGLPKTYTLVAKKGCH